MKRKRFKHCGLMVVLLVYLVMAMLLFIERTGIQYPVSVQRIASLSADQIVFAKDALAQQEEECLVLIDSQNSLTTMVLDEFQRIFLDMKVNCRWLDIRSEQIPEFTDYRTVVVLMNDLSPLGEQVTTLLNWVEAGGCAMFPLVLINNDALQMISHEMGFEWIDVEHVYVDSICLADGFMLGGDDRSYEIEDAFKSSLDAELTEKATCLAWVGNEYSFPLIWTAEHGEGRFVVVNLGMYEKNLRGFYAAAYSMLEDAFAYPVINGSAFYLDDFPSPVPGGDGTYIRRDYDMSISEFYTNIWWPEMLKMAQKYGVVYSAMVIQNYDDDISGEIVPQLDINQFKYFGNQVLRYGGEIGYHGYNHQPLCLNNIDYGGLLPYNTWGSVEDMKNAVNELVNFTRDLFPVGHQSVYVPPSNVLSAEGRQMLSQEFPQIRTIASNFTEGDFAYVQEFEVAQDGIVEQPRVISGFILYEYMKLSALSELNMHFVNTHFTHPDDLLDVARGADMGWEELRNRLDSYMAWLYGAVPSLRNLTASELSGAIQRYGSLAVHRDIRDGQMTLTLGNYVDEANLLVRLDGKENVQLQGGTLTWLTDSLYLLCAQQGEVTLTWDR